MMQIVAFAYKPIENEAEKSSNGYLMSLIAIMTGLPLPIFNLLATLFFYVANRKSTYFVRWHCIQALLSQFSLFCINSIAFWWTMSIFFGSKFFTYAYFAYMFTVFLFSLIDFIATIYTAIQVRKGVHVEWWFYGKLTNLICKP